MVNQFSIQDLTKALGKVVADVKTGIEGEQTLRRLKASDKWPEIKKAIGKKLEPLERELEKAKKEQEELKYLISLKKINLSMDKGFYGNPFATSKFLNPDSTAQPSNPFSNHKTF